MLKIDDARARARENTSPGRADPIKVRIGISSEPSPAVYGSKRFARAVADVGDLRLRAREHRVVEDTRDVERRLPELVEVARAGSGSSAPPTPRRSPRLPAGRARAAFSPSANGPGAPSGGGSTRPRSASSSARQPCPRVVLNHIPNRERHMTFRAQHAARLSQRRQRVDHQHVAPAAEHDVHACDRQVDPFGVEHLELDISSGSVRPHACARRRASHQPDHWMIRATDGRHHLGREKARLAEAGGHSSTRWPG